MKALYVNHTRLHDRLRNWFIPLAEIFCGGKMQRRSREPPVARGSSKRAWCLDDELTGRARSRYHA